MKEHPSEITIREERLTVEEYIDFLKRTDLGSQYPKERFAERIAKLVQTVSVSLIARDERGLPVGVLMARKNGIPDIVTDFIHSHHGRSLTRFFYTQYCNAGGDPENKAPFTYDGILPQTKEQAVLMIADSIEAASRTLKNYSAETISALVEKIVAGKMEEHQFDEADISLRELGLVKESLKNYLLQIYHARISYPKQKKQAQAAPKEG